MHYAGLIDKVCIVTKDTVKALITAARASGGKDECVVRRTGIEGEYWMGTDIG